MLFIGLYKRGEKKLIKTYLKKHIFDMIGISLLVILLILIVLGYGNQCQIKT
jgi:hypothetical protein